MGKSKIKTVMALGNRIINLQRKIPYFDASITIGGDASYIAKLRGKKAITFNDNEIAQVWRYSRFSDYAFWPNAVEFEKIVKVGFKRDEIYMYDGFKEDLYLADYVPNENFKKDIPFDNFVIVRPENLKAKYVKGENFSIVPDLIKKLLKENYNILFLPRYEDDINYISEFKNSNQIYVPKGAIDGLDACFYSNAVLTGAGTMAREAACLGIPAISFFAGKDLLTVDKKMINDKLMFFSRNTDDIMSFLKQSGKRQADISRSKKVKEEILNKIDEVLDRFLK